MIGTYLIATHRQYDTPHFSLRSNNDNIIKCYEKIYTIFQYYLISPQFMSGLLDRESGLRAQLKGKRIWTIK